MADWFKFYENSLDEARFRWAVRTLSGVCPVYVGILVECCRHRSEKIRWEDDEATLFGIADRVGVTVEVLRQAVVLLAKIDYIKVADGFLILPKWNYLQSDYMQRKSRLLGVATHNPVRTLSEHCPNKHIKNPLEERRGEENDKAFSTKAKHRPKLTLWQKELADKIEKALGIQWVNDAGKWINRIKSKASKCERVIAELESALKEKRVRRSPAAYAEQIWKEFA